MEEQKGQRGGNQKEESKEGRRMPREVSGGDKQANHKAGRLVLNPWKKVLGG